MHVCECVCVLCECWWLSCGCGQWVAWRAAGVQQGLRPCVQPAPRCSAHRARWPWLSLRSAPRAWGAAAGGASPRRAARASPHRIPGEEVECSARAVVVAATGPAPPLRVSSSLSRARKPSRPAATRRATARRRLHRAASSARACWELIFYHRTFKIH